MITADGGSRMGKTVLYKSLVDEALKLARHPPQKVLIFKRGLDYAMPVVQGRDVDWKALARKTLRTRSLPAPGSSRTSPRTSCTPRARPGSRKACSATSAATRWARRVEKNIFCA